MLTGCGKNAIMNEDTVLSQDLPLTMRDFDEIRRAEKRHEELTEPPPQWRKGDASTHTPLWLNAELEAYVRAIGLKVARKSGRPDLPYEFYLLDSDEVDIFSVGGGKIYLTRGAFGFIESEAELAAVIGHEIGHTCAHHYMPEKPNRKIQKTYKFLVQATDLAQGVGGPFASGAHHGLRAIGKVAPSVKKRFGQNDEIEADSLGFEYMVRAGYDPRALLYFQEKVSRVRPDDVGPFLELINGHPPFKQRRQILTKHTGSVDAVKLGLQAAVGSIEGISIQRTHPDLESEVQITVAPAGTAPLSAAPA